MLCREFQEIWDCEHTIVIPSEEITKSRNLFARDSMEKQYSVYILRSFSGNFYIGITSNLVKRLWEHKSKIVEGFTKKYNVDKLIYYEVYESVEAAILREKQLKKWSRRKKVELITRVNPTFTEITIQDIF